MHVHYSYCISGAKQRVCGEGGSNEVIIIIIDMNARTSGRPCILEFLAIKTGSRRVESGPDYRKHGLGGHKTRPWCQKHLPTIKNGSQEIKNVIWALLLQGWKTGPSNEENTTLEVKKRVHAVENMSKVSM